MPEYSQVNDEQCVEDPGILDTDSLLRRVHPFHLTEVVERDNSRRLRPSSNAFKDSTHPSSPVSAAQQKLVQDVAKYMASSPGFFLATVEARLPRELGLVVSSVPAVQGEPEHVFIAGKKTNSKTTRLAVDCRWVIPPPAVAR
jgi:hypothetical protein